MYTYVYICTPLYNWRKFRSQTFDNMGRWSSRGGKRQRRESKKKEDQRGESKKKEDQGARKGTKRFVFPMFCGSGGSKSRLAKAAGAEPSEERSDQKLHAIVTGSIFRSQNVQNTSVLSASESWHVEQVYVVVARSYTTLHVTTLLYTNYATLHYTTLHLQLQLQHLYNYTTIIIWYCRRSVSMSIYLSVYLSVSVYLSTYLSINLSIYRSIYLSDYLSFWLSDFLTLSNSLSLSVCLSLSLSVCLSLCLSVSLSLCLSVCLSVCLSILLFVYPSMRLSI